MDIQNHGRTLLFRANLKIELFKRWRFCRQKLDILQKMAYTFV